MRFQALYQSEGLIEVSGGHTYSVKWWVKYLENGARKTYCSVLFLAVLDPRVGYTMDVLEVAGYATQHSDADTARRRR